MLLRGKHKPGKSMLNAYALETEMDKEVKYVWTLPLKIYSVRQVNEVGVVPLGVANKFSINEKRMRYTKRHITHDCSLPIP